jgi:hypothetical protein
MFTSSQVDVKGRVNMKRNVIRKSALIGLYLTVQGMMLQLGKNLLFFHKKSPSVDFIIQVCILYFITGFLFALGFYLLDRFIPGRSRLSKGVSYALLVYFAVAFGGLIGVIGLDPLDTNYLFTPYKIDSYVIAISDLINFLLVGIVLGLSIKSENFKAVPRKKGGKRLMAASIIGFFAFPALGFILLKLTALVIPLSMGFTPAAEARFYSGTFIPLSVTGAMIPVFYLTVMDFFPGDWKKKGVMFFLFYYFAYWAISIVFGLPFGLSTQAVAAFLISSFVSLFASILLSAGILAKEN